MMDDLDIVRKATARRMKLSVDPRTGRVRLVLPKKAPLAPALEWAKAHEGWISRQISRLPEPWPITPGMMIPFGGADYQLDWHEAHPRTPRPDADRILVGGPLELMPARLLRWMRREAHMRLEAETRALAELHDISVRAIGVGDPRSRWGSCSSTGDIRYSWRLILAPEFVRKATVTHELAHRIHMDHSAAFHQLAAELYGSDPAPARDWLRRHGARLYWFGRAG